MKPGKIALLLLFILALTAVFICCAFLFPHERTPPWVVIDYSCWKFEDFATYADLILKGKCVAAGNRENGLDAVTGFEVQEVYYGNVEAPKIIVTGYSPESLQPGSSSGNSFYEPGKEYFLVLTDASSPYEAADRYVSVCDELVLPVESASESELLGKPLGEVSDIGTVETAADIENYLRLLIEKDIFLDKEEHGFIHATDPATVIGESGYILELRVGREDTGTWKTTGGERFRFCKVERVLRGDVKEGETVRVRIKVGDAGEGDRVIIALSEIGLGDSVRTFKYSSRNSVFRQSQRETVAALIGKTEAAE